MDKRSKLYIAGKWSEKAEISAMITHLQSRGYLITHDWTKSEFQTTNPCDLAKMAYLDLEGVKKADVLIAVMTDPSYPYRGTFTEIGCALGLGKHVIIISPEGTTTANYISNCFYHHPDIIHVHSWNDALRLVELN